jgi:hypothetical protein
VNAADLLAIWEDGRQMPPLRRARLLSTLTPDDASQAAPSIGETNARLLSLRRLLFGSAIAGMATCPSCDSKLDVTMRVEDFLAACQDHEGSSGTRTIEVDGQALHFRLPTLEDLEAVDQSLSYAEAQTQLLRACVHDIDPAQVTQLNEPLLAEMARLDPLAEPNLALTCEACGHAFTLAFDVSAFLWREIEGWVARLLGDVHIIASAYGWSEREILSLSPTRRQVYLDLICA